MRSGLEAIKALAKFGFYATRHRKGSHVVLCKESTEGAILVVVPLHKELKTGTLRGIIRQAKISVDDFVSVL